MAAAVFFCNVNASARKSKRRVIDAQQQIGFMMLKLGTSKLPVYAWAIRATLSMCMVFTARLFFTWLRVAMMDTMTQCIGASLLERCLVAAKGGN